MNQFTTKDETHSGAQLFSEIVIKTQVDGSGQKGLVVGFGDGHEADFLGDALKETVYGIDIRPPALSKHSFIPTAADAGYLPYLSNTFSFVFYHHVIEHVPEPIKTISEIRRVLQPYGVLFIGTPNRHRLVGYVGSYQVPVRDKIKWNLIDYRDRALGRFRNELGAHAGYSRGELSVILNEYFSDVEWITREYLYYKYSDRLPGSLMKLFRSDLFLEFFAPAIYALCRNKKGS